MNENQHPSSQQQKLLEFIWRYRQEHHRSPTYREMEQPIGANSPAVPNHHVRRLEKMDYLHRDEHVARSLRLTEKALIFLRQCGVPVLIDPDIVQFQIRGEIIAGKPVDPFGQANDDDDTVIVDGRLLPKRRDNLFALRVRGDSMIDALVQEGDIVLLQRECDVRNGDMVAAWLLMREETTLKHIYLEGATARLQPANPEYKTLLFPASNVQIQGKVVMVLRQSALSTDYA